MSEERTKLIPSAGYRCDCCEERKDGEPNEYDDFDATGNVVQRSFCDECVEGFDKVGIVFDFKNEIQFDND